jgi:hypothetical protein
MVTLYAETSTEGQFTQDGYNNNVYTILNPNNTTEFYVNRENVYPYCYYTFIKARYCEYINLVLRAQGKTYTVSIRVIYDGTSNWTEIESYNFPTTKTVHKSAVGSKILGFGFYSSAKKTQGYNLALWNMNAWGK